MLSFETSGKKIFLAVLILSSFASSVFAAGTIQGTAQSQTTGQFDFSHNSSNVTISTSGCGLNSVSGKVYNNTLGLVDFSQLSVTYTGGQSTARVTGAAVTNSGERIYFDTNDGNVTIANVTAPAGSAIPFAGQAFSPTLGAISFSGVTTLWRPNCANPTAQVDIKANNSDGPVSVSTESSVILAWNSADTGVISCAASGSWSGTRPPSGTETLTNLISSGTYTLICGSVSDSVTIKVADVVPPPPPIVSPYLCPSVPLTLDLRRSNTDPRTGGQVSSLQRYLYQFKNDLTFGISGLSESYFTGGYFGLYTHRAVIAFQNKFGVSPADRVVSQTTRDTILQNCTPGPTPPKVACPLPAVTDNLAYGARNTVRGDLQVSSLQAFLYQYKEIFPGWRLPSARSSFVTGSYYIQTRNAIQKFQGQFGLITSDKLEYGRIGEQTRNAIIAQCDPSLPSPDQNPETLSSPVFPPPPPPPTGTNQPPPSPPSGINLPPPSQTLSSIQGITYNFGPPAVGISTTVRLGAAAVTTNTANNYVFKFLDLQPGQTYTVTIDVPVGYQASNVTYSSCVYTGGIPTNCHSNWIPGTSATVAIPAVGAVDLWWRL